ncbi:hypothetical protein [Sphingobium nicotianae]|uniref:Uncharacterized protein n=1 Tax=Sphingobium nicotianae TaxID=2782607 RepID=A0A9X1IRF9_9SPHN|nr:hypothetical protein [Sphingobium nicotianae]MBT2187185.1 hypothetical protein [Sphingobium nicotianae]
MRLFRSRSFYWLLVGAGMLLVILANAHLVYVATQSDPGCATSDTKGQAAGTQIPYSPAKPAC